MNKTPSRRATRGASVRSIGFYAGLAGLAAVTPQLTHAAQPATGQSALQGIIDEVLVTARRREESLQEVPIAMSAFGGEQLLDRGVNDVKDLSFQLPTVKITGHFTSGSANTQYRVRGVPGVVVYEDGVPIISQAAQNIIDVERIEVLRGPQGTLFGRTATGGALQIISRRPTHEFAGDTGIVFGSNDRIDLTARVNIPLTDTLAVKFTGSSLQRDGFVQSTADPDLRFGTQDDKLARADFLWTPNDRFEGRFIYTFSEQASIGGATTTLKLDPVCPGDPAPDQWQGRDGTPRFYAPNALCIIRNLDLDPNTPGVQAWDSQFHEYAAREEYKTTIADVREHRYWQENRSAILDLSYELSDRWDLRWVSGYRSFDIRSGESLDGTGLDIYQRTHWDVPITEQQEQRTSELQLNFNGQRFSGTTGLYYQDTPGAVGKRISWSNSELLNPTLRAAAEAAYPGSTYTTAQLSALGPAALALLRDNDPNTYPVLAVADQFHPAGTPLQYSSLNSASAPFFVGRGVSPNATQTEQEIMAVFAEWSVAITDSLNLTAGIRYTDQTNTTYIWNAGAQPNNSFIPDDYQNADPGVDYLVVAGSPTATAESTLEQWTPRISLQYQWTPDLMTYLTYSKGATAGGLNSNPPAPLTPFPFAGETVKNYELGMRSDWFDGRLRVNATAFFMDYKDLLAQEEIVVGTYVSFNADAEVKGFELEGLWQVTDGFSINYAVGYVDAEYTSIGTTLNLRPGTPFPQSPELAYSTGAQQLWRLGSGARLALRGDWSWQDETQSVTERLNAVKIDAHGLLNARLTYTSSDGTWDAALSGTNLADEYYWTSGFQVTGATQVNLGRPREFGVHFNYRFD